MKAIFSILTSSIGRKLVLSATGLFLIVFLTGHLAGNLKLLTYKADYFNDYADKMSNSGIVYVLEVLTFGSFLIHAMQAFLLYFQNRAARGQGYKVNKASANSSSFSRKMIYTGSLVLVFLIWHLKSFFAHKVEHWLGMAGKPNHFNEVRAAFSDPIYVVLYVLSMIILGFHLNHGFQSAFQTLGINDKKYTPVIANLGRAYSILVPLLFAFIPVYFYFELNRHFTLFKII